MLISTGVKSPLRSVVTELDTKDTLSFSNTVCYRGLVAREEAAARGVDTSFWDYPMNCIGVGKVRCCRSLRCPYLTERIARNHLPDLARRGGT